MDSLPALHPIALDHISSPPFEYSPKGLTFKSHPRESIADLKKWLFPKRKNSAPLNKNKDWWLAQLRLHGINVKASMKKEASVEALKGALSRGLSGPPEEILQLEQKLERKYLLENAEAREREYATLSDEKRAAKYSERFLRERFLNGNEKLLALDLEYKEGRDRVHHAATKLGLHSETACGPQRRMWTIIGKHKRHVQKRKSALEKKSDEWELEHRAAKKRKIERHRQECEAGGEGSCKDVEGEWSIECPKMDLEYDEAHRSMSIFFHKTFSTRDDDQGYTSCEYSEDDEAEEHNDTREVCLSPILCANFTMGIVEGTLRSRVDLPAQCTSFPVPTVPFTWRGRETGMGEIQLDYQGNVNIGSFDFISKTQLKGVFNFLGKWSFTGSKVANSPADTRDVWENYSAEAYERARVARWR